MTIKTLPGSVIRTPGRITVKANFRGKKGYNKKVGHYYKVHQYITDLGNFTPGMFTTRSGIFYYMNEKGDLFRTNISNLFKVQFPESGDIVEMKKGVVLFTPLHKVEWLFCDPI